MRHGGLNTTCAGGLHWREEEYNNLHLPVEDGGWSGGSGRVELGEGRGRGREGERRERERERWRVIVLV